MLPAMELGCDGVLINTAIAKAKKPILMAKAFKDAVVAGRNSFLAGRMKKITLDHQALLLKELFSFFSSSYPKGSKLNFVFTFLISFLSFLFLSSLFFVFR